MESGGLKMFPVCKCMTCYTIVDDFPVKTARVLVLDRNYEIGDWAGVPRPAVTRNGTGEFVGPSARWAAGMSSPLGSTLQRLRRRDVKNPMH